MPYGTMSDELYVALKEQGITTYKPQQGEGTWARIDVVFAGALDESFDVSLTENDVQAIVSAIYEFITSRSYAIGEDVIVAAYETNGEDYNERRYSIIKEN